MSGARAATLAVAVLLATAACGGAGDEGERAGEAPAAPAEAQTAGTPPAEAPRPEAELVPVGWEEWQERLAGYRGEIVVVDLWATWCLPCIERFPRMVELHREYSPRGVTFVSLSLDDRTDAAALARARRFLAEQEAEFDHYLMDEGMTEAFEKLDILGIPAVFVYDRRGELRHRLTGDDPNDQFTDADVEAAVRELLAEG